MTIITPGTTVFPDAATHLNPAIRLVEALGLTVDDDTQIEVVAKIIAALQAQTEGARLLLSALRPPVGFRYLLLSTAVPVPAIDTSCLLKIKASDTDRVEAELDEGEEIEFESFVYPAIDVISGVPTRVFLAPATAAEVATGTDAQKVVTPDGLASLWEKGSNIASASTISIGEGGVFHITGTATITDIDFGTDRAGRSAVLIFDGALTLTHSASTLVLPTGANITTAAGDACLVVSEGSDAVRAGWYQRASGAALVGGAATASTTEVLTGTDTAKAVTPDALAALWEQGSNIASAGTISVGEGGLFHVTGTTTITDIDFATDKAGRSAVLVFDGALTLTHNASTLILPGGANITTAAGDIYEVVSEGADVVRVVGYQLAGGKALGLGTGDSPQFAGVNIGHASDTTLARSAAGRATVEGIEVILERGIETLTDGATITIDLSVAPRVWEVTVAGNRTLAASNASGKNGLQGLLILTQDATGGRTLTEGTDVFASDTTGGVFVLNAAANAKTFLPFVVQGNQLRFG